MTHHAGHEAGPPANHAAARPGPPAQPSPPARPVPPDDAPVAGLDVAAAVHGWLLGRRWFPAKGTQATFERVTRIVLPGPPAPAPLVFVDVLRALGAGPDGAPVILQVPLVLETDAPVPDPGSGADVSPSPAGLIAYSGTTRLYDGTYHPAFVAAWLALATWSPCAPATPRPFDLRGMRVLTGEQSNTSVLLPRVAGGSMLKIFRSLASGQNPDVVVPRALAEVGWSGVPAPYAWSEITLDDPASASAEQTWTAHSGVLAELVPDARDGFELACEHARDGRPFDDLARDLGAQVAGMHAALRAAFPGDVATADATWLLAELRRRVRTAAATSPAVRARAELIEEFWGRLRTASDEAARQGRSLPPLQRIHGDLHLGQVLHSAATGWRILDFEGEPLRPLDERTRPDLGERDVAGMLRSFDYAAAVGEAAEPGWAHAARRSFLEGYYGAASGDSQDRPTPADRVVLDAFELDKALYEVVYEERNRPGWVAIPLAAVDRILCAHLHPAPLQAGDPSRP